MVLTKPLKDIFFSPCTYCQQLLILEYSCLYTAKNGCQFRRKMQACELCCSITYFLLLWSFTAVTIVFHHLHGY